MMILSPRAVARLESYTRLAHAKDFPPDQRRQADRGHLSKAQRSTRLRCLRSKITFWRWMGALGWWVARVNCRAPMPTRKRSGLLRHRNWIDNLAQIRPRDQTPRSALSSPTPRSPTGSVCQSGGKAARGEDVALDIGAYRDAPPGLRIWCGGTVETATSWRCCPGSTGHLS